MQMQVAFHILPAIGHPLNSRYGNKLYFLTNLRAIRCVGIFFGRTFDATILEPPNGAKLHAYQAKFVLTVCPTDIFVCSTYQRSEGAAGRTSNLRWCPDFALWSSGRSV